jgi:hypothetical protein
MEPEDSDHAIEHEDRRGEHGAGVELNQALDSAQCRIRESGLIADVAEGHGLPFASGEVRDREMVGDSPDRSEPGGGPLSGNRHRLARFAEPEEAAADACGHAGRLDRDSEHVVEVELGADLSADRCDEAFALEGVRRASAERARVERERGPAASPEQRQPSVNTRGALSSRRRAPPAPSSETSGTKTAPSRRPPARRRFTCCELATS